MRLTVFGVENIVYNDNTFKDSSIGIGVYEDGSIKISGSSNIFTKTSYISNIRMWN